MGHVRFGLIVPEDALNRAGRPFYMEDIHRLLTYVTGHFDSAWFIDHLQRDVLEGWTALTYLSALHPELLWGHTVLCQSFRNPGLVAKMGATLHFMSGGRFILGIGAGGQEGEYLAFGYDFPPGNARVAELDEALHIITAMWTQTPATFEGTYHRVKDAWCEPQPDPLPTIMVGAFGPRMLRVTARHADWWNVSSTGIEDYHAYLAEFERACDEIGRDPATVRRTWSGGCVCGPTEGEVADLAAGRLQMGEEFAYHKGEDLVGTPAQIIEQMRPFVELGVDYFMLDCGGFPRRQRRKRPATLCGTCQGPAGRYRSHRFPGRSRPAPPWPGSKRPRLAPRRAQRRAAVR
jgi:alkanesulfonate monooxygenase SsuD/methylene tetrahydromethanopterin reductase-like flavin-dependent oxidoreductase (luciferase family)